jgi:hypothetical protein
VRGLVSPSATGNSSRPFAVWHDGVPTLVRILFVGLVAVIIGLAVHGLVGLGGSGIHTWLDAWLTCAAEGLAAVLCAFAAMRSERNRVAWLLIAVGMGLWATGDVIWAIRGDPLANATVSDVFWLAWYPLLVVALVLLVRDRVPRFELHRWIDGVIVMLVVVTPWVALFLEPAASHSKASTVVDAIDFAYPLGDAILVGAMLGVLALMGWRAGPMWFALVVGFTALGLADAVYSVDALGHSYSSDTVFDALWLGGLVVIAYAAWLPHPGRLEPVDVYGWRAIALPLAAQCFALALQIYGLFVDVPLAERALTIAVLIIAIVQIVVSRPRLPREIEQEREELDEGWGASERAP